MPNFMKQKMGGFIRAFGADTREAEGENRRIIVYNLPPNTSMMELMNFFGSETIEGISLYEKQAFIQFKRAVDHTQSLLRNMEKWKGREIVIKSFDKSSLTKSYAKPPKIHRSAPSPDHRDNQKYKPRESSSDRRDKDRSLVLHRERSSTRHRERSSERDRDHMSSRSRDHSHARHGNDRLVRSRSRSRSRSKSKTRSRESSRMRMSGSSSSHKLASNEPMPGAHVGLLTSTETLWSNFPAQRTFASPATFAHARAQPQLYPHLQPLSMPMPVTNPQPHLSPQSSVATLPRAESHSRLEPSSQPLAIEAAPSNGTSPALPDRIKILLDLVRQGGSVYAASVSQIKELQKFFNDAAIEMESQQSTPCIVEPATSQSGDSTCNDSNTNGAQDTPSREEAALQLVNKIRGSHS